MLSQERRVFLPFPLITGLVLLISLAGLLFVTACGGGGSIAGEPQPLSPTSVQFKLGDAPADRLLGLEVNLTAVHVKDSKGNQINVLPQTRRMEFLHTAGTLEPVVLLDVPQGTYSEATFEGSNLHVSYLSYTEGGFMLTETAISDLGTVTVPISPALTVGAQPLIVSIDFDVASFISFDPVDGHVILNDPKFTFSSAAPDIPSGKPFPYPEIGGLEDMLGQVTNVSGSAFTMTLGQNGMPLTFNTDSNTVFDGVSLSTLSNMIVKVIGVTRSDGTVYARQVQALENHNGVETEGVIYWRYPAALWFWLTPQDGNGVGFEFNPTTAVGQVVDVDASETSYSINTDGMDMTGAAFNFDANTYPNSVRFGQRVRVESTTGMLPDPGGTSGFITSQKVILEKQAVSGTVSNYTVSGDRAFFVLQLPTDSYLTILNSAQGPPATYINVWQQAGTDLHNLTGVKDGDVVRVRGLLFTLDDGNFVMVAQRIWK